MNAIRPPAFARGWTEQRRQRNESVRWAVWLGADTSRRLAIERGIDQAAAAHLLAAVERDGLIVAMGKRTVRTGAATVYATPDPVEFP